MILKQNYYYLFDIYFLTIFSDKTQCQMKPKNILECISDDKSIIPFFCFEKYLK